MSLTIYPRIADDPVDGPASSTDNAIARFDGTTGTSLQNSTITVSDTGTIAAASGSLTLTTPVLGVATATSINGNTFTAGTYTLTGTAAKTLNFTNTLTLTGTDSTTMTFPGETASVGYLNMPQNSKSAAYEFVALDSGKQIYHPASDANSRAFTIPKNATIPYALGTCITLTNDSANDITMVIDTDTLNYVDTGVVTTVTIPQYNTVTIQKTTTTSWLCSGSSGVTTA